MVPCAHQSLNLNGISFGSAIFARLTSVTDRLTDHATQLVIIGRIYVHTGSTVMRPKKMSFKMAIEDTTPQPFYGPFSRTTRVSWCQKSTSGLYGAREADTPTIWMVATPSGLSSAHLHHPPFFTSRMPFLPPNQQCQSTEGN